VSGTPAGKAGAGRVNRRNLLKLGFGAAAAGAGLAGGAAQAEPIPYLTYLGLDPVAPEADGRPFRRVSLRNLHTGEGIDAVYWEHGRYLPDAMAEVNWVMRDHRTGEVRQIHARLLDTLDRLAHRLDVQRPYQLISGYRSPHTNAMLRERGRGGVAARSLHMDGMASDIRVERIDLDRLHAAASSLRSGGVGYYPVSNFVHVDVGAVRRWRGV
jgi:uncharacterized protein YcbK (DUF882 family)